MLKILADRHFKGFRHGHAPGGPILRHPCAHDSCAALFDKCYLCLTFMKIKFKYFATKNLFNIQLSYTGYPLTLSGPTERWEALGS